MTQARTHPENRGVSETSITQPTDGKAVSRCVEGKDIVFDFRGMQAHVDTGRPNG